MKFNRESKRKIVYEMKSGLREVAWDLEALNSMKTF